LQKLGVKIGMFWIRVDFDLELVYFRKNIKKVLEDIKRLLPLPPRNETDWSHERRLEKKMGNRKWDKRGKNTISSLTF